MNNFNYIFDEFFFRLIFVCLSHLHLLSKSCSWDIVVLSCPHFLNEAISLLNLKSSQKLMLTVEGVTLCKTKSDIFLLWILGMLFLLLALPASEEKKWSFAGSVSFYTLRKNPKKTRLKNKNKKEIEKSNMKLKCPGDKKTK